MSKRHFLTGISLLLCLTLPLGITGCKDSVTSPDNGSTDNTDKSNASVNEEYVADTSSFVTFKEKDLNDFYDDTSAVHISLNKSAISCDSDTVSITDSVITITSAGTYVFEGSLDDGQIIVNAGDSDDVILVLNNADITCLTSAPIYVQNADKTIITLPSGTNNSLTDGSSYEYTDAEAEEPNSTIFSKDDLTVNGEGTLTINANFNNAITGKDDLKLLNCTLIIDSVNHGIKGKDSVTISGGTYSVTCGGDGIKASNDTDEGKGYIHIISGTFNISAGDDGIQGENTVYIENGTFNITTASGKGIKSGTEVITDDGEFDISTADDSLHSNGSLTVNNGAFTIAGKDDGIHAETTLIINNGEITITESYEGLEAAEITINNGVSFITSSDDGVNAASGSSNNSEGAGNFPGGKGEKFNGNPGDAMSSSDCHVTINDGILYVNANGDGLDSNGTLTVNGGYIIVNGPEGSGNGGIDYGSSFEINGGYLAVTGSSGMATGCTGGTQCSALIGVSNASSNETITVAKDDGSVIISFTPVKTWSALNVSTPDMSTGETYHIYRGGTLSGSTDIDKICSVGGNISGGTLLTDFTQTDTIYSEGGFMGGGMGGGGRGHGGDFNDNRSFMPEDEDDFMKQPPMADTPDAL